MPKRRSKKTAKSYLPPDKRKGLNPPEPFRSWLEADVAHDLSEQGVDFEYESETIIYVVPAQTHRYTPDIKLPNGIIVEVKGRWTAIDRKKMGLVLEQNPDKDIRILFAIDNKISKNSRTRYSTWCKRRGIKYAIGRAIPKEWLEE
jgi:hypothetical protein